LNQLQIALGVEALHDDGGAADPDGQVDGGLRRGVIERRGREIDHALAVLPELLQEIEQRQLLLWRLFGQGPQDALRPSGGAGGIEHRGADALVRDGRRWQAGGGIRKADDALALALAVSNDAKLDPLAALDRLARDIELRPGGDENA